MRKITTVFKGLMSTESPFTSRQLKGLALMLLAGIVAFSVVHYVVVHEWFYTVSANPRSILVWVAAAIFFVAALIPRVKPAIVSRYNAALAISFCEGLGVLAVLGLGKTLFDTLPAIAGGIGYVALLALVFWLICWVHSPKATAHIPTQPQTHQQTPQ